MSVYTKIHAVMTALGKNGIAKDHRNETQGFKFRGIDDVMTALSPLLVEHGLVILPEMGNRTVAEHKTNRGGTLFSVTLEGKFTFVDVDDPVSQHSVTVLGEGMDSGDKATAKAMSCAYKYACLQVFCVPVEGLPNAEDDDHTVDDDAPSRPQEAAARFVAEVPVYDPNQDWRKEICHIGERTKNKALGEISETDLHYLVKNWKPKHFPKGMRLIDAQLRSALDAADAELDGDQLP